MERKREDRERKGEEGEGEERERGRGRRERGKRKLFCIFIYHEPSHATYHPSPFHSPYLHPTFFSPQHTQNVILPCTDVPDFPHVGEDDMVLPLVQHPPPLGQPRIHAWVLHKVTDENIETPEVGRL